MKDFIIAAYEEIEAEALDLGMNLDRPGVRDDLWRRAELRVGDQFADAADRAHAEAKDRIAGGQG